VAVTKEGRKKTTTTNHSRRQPHHHTYDDHSGPWLPLHFFSLLAFLDGTFEEDGGWRAEPTILLVISILRLRLLEGFLPLEGFIDHLNFVDASSPSAVFLLAMCVCLALGRRV
jgi:hypothetical protein